MECNQRKKKFFILTFHFVFRFLYISSVFHVDAAFSLRETYYMCLIYTYTLWHIFVKKVKDKCKCEKKKQTEQNENGNKHNKGASQSILTKKTKQKKRLNFYTSNSFFLFLLDKCVLYTMYLYVILRSSCYILYLTFIVLTIFPNIFLRAKQNESFIK